MFEEASFSSPNNTDKRAEYEPIDYSDSDIASEEEVLLPRSRRAPKRFPEGQWARSIAKMANVDKANVTEIGPVTRLHEKPRVVLTRRIVVGRIRKSLSPPLSRNRNIGRGASVTAEQRAKEIVRALQVLYARRVRKGKWRTGL
jgi:hypothetical protein